MPKKDIKIIIVGEDKFSQPKKIKSNTTKFLEKYHYFDYNEISAEIILMKNDKFSEVAKESIGSLGIPIKVIKPNGIHGKAAEKIRNGEAISYINKSNVIGIVLAFTEGNNYDIKDLLNSAKENNIETHIINQDK